MEKIKHFISSKAGQDILIIIIIILVGLGSFELGRLSKDNNGTGLKIESKTGEVYNSANLSQSADNLINRTKTEGKNFFASKLGKKYYPADCSAGKNIKLSNRVYFDTREEAESKGYSLSSSCSL